MRIALFLMAFIAFALPKGNSAISGFLDEVFLDDKCHFVGQILECHNWGLNRQIKARCVPSDEAGPDCVDLCRDNDAVYDGNPSGCMCCPEKSDDIKPPQCKQNENCLNKFDGHGRCYHTQQDGRDCIQSQHLCPSNSEFGTPCYCCGKKVIQTTPPPCKNLGCSNKVKGGKCYPSKQNGMTCVKSDELCKGTSPNSDCYCCSEVADRPCQDYGCKDFFNGQGICSTKVTKDSICADSDELCCDRKETSCKWTGWIDRDQPNGNGDYEQFIPPFSYTPPYATKIGPGTQCEFPEYKVKIKGHPEVYDDVNDLPGSWVIHDRPVGIYCVNAEQTTGQQCPDLEVNYKCCTPTCRCCMVDTD